MVAPSTKRLVVLVAVLMATASVVVPQTAADAPVVPPAPEVEPPPEPLSDAELRRLGVNELGRVVVMEWHDVDDTDGRWDISRQTFRAQIQALYDRGYRPVTMAEYIDGTFPIPPGTTPVILTFDDSFRSHLHFDDDGDPHPDSVVGMLEDFSHRHPDWRATAIFYIFWPRPFREAGLVEEKLRWLVENGYELGNHSYNHDHLGILDDTEVQCSLGGLQQVVDEVLPGYRMRSFALPFGVWPENRELAAEGECDGVAYRHEVVLLVGDMPYHPPYHVDFDPMRVMRVQAYPPEFHKWLDWMDAVPSRRFVSDGDPTVVTVPRSRAEDMLPVPRRVRVYED